MSCRPNLLFLSREPGADHSPTPTSRVRPTSRWRSSHHSTDERDRTVKRKLYAEHGVKEYWLVDPDAMTVTVLLLGESDFEEAGVYRKGQALTSPTLEGFSVNLERHIPGLGQSGILG